MLPHDAQAITILLADDDDDDDRMLAEEARHEARLANTVSAVEDGEELRVELTTLPNTYRFRAGGSRSVRGYTFESLSNNGFGSNHIITASAELEYNVVGGWAGALFYDVGNAFNDWDNPELHKGIGVGIRWYSIAGPIRVDVAQAMDFDGKPWRLHVTIGVPLL